MYPVRSLLNGRLAESSKQSGGVHLSKVRVSLEKSAELITRKTRSVCNCVYGVSSPRVSQGCVWAT